MCKNNKKCKKCSSIKIGSTMAKTKRRRPTSVTIKQEDIMYTALGAGGGMVANKFINQAVESQPQNTKDMIGKALPFLKILAGGYLATAKGQARNIRFLGVGMAGAGAVEAVVKFLPEYAAIGGVGDLYQSLGSTDQAFLLDIGTEEIPEGTRDLELADTGEALAVA